MNNKRKKTTLIVIIFVLCISIGYAFLSTVLNVKTNISLSPVSFTVHFDNVVSLSDNATENAHITNDDKTEISLTADLTKIGDKYSFTTDIVNESTLPGKVKTIELSGISEANMKLIKYNVFYTSNKKEVKVGDYIGPGETKNITVEFVYDLDDSITNDDISDEGVILSGTFGIKYENARLDEYLNSALANKIKGSEQPYPSGLVEYNKPVPATEHQGLYVLDSTTNDTFPIYFYRGGHESVYNHVIFANYCWRIIRTTNTGGIKMIYNGEPTDGECINHPTSSDNTQLPDSSYGTGSSINGNEISRALSAFYFEHLMNYQGFIEDAPYCNKAYQSGDISLNCDDEDIENVYNNKLTYPIGLLTAQEANLCGSHTNTSIYPWLTNSLAYWTMSEDSYNVSRTWYIKSDGSISTWYYQGGYTAGAIPAGGAGGVRPVIAISSDASITSGDGTYNNPYIIS